MGDLDLVSVDQEVPAREALEGRNESSLQSLITTRMAGLIKRSEPKLALKRNRVAALVVPVVEGPAVLEGPVECEAQEALVEHDLLPNPE